jgi:uncharacterized membrane protein
MNPFFGDIVIAYQCLYSGSYFSPIGNSRKVLALVDSQSHSASASAGWTRASAMLLIGCAMQAFGWQSLLSTRSTSSFLSAATWQATVESLGGTISSDVAAQAIADVPFFGLFVRWVAVAVLCVGMASVVCLIAKQTVSQVVPKWLDRGCRAWCLMGIWECLRLACFLAGWNTLQAMLETWGFYFFAVSMAGWAVPFLVEVGNTNQTRHSESVSNDDASVLSIRLTKTVWIGIGLYVLAFTWMNWQLYRGLLLPHGDSAMYEEHLWNLLHGKGFRSYLDQGLFFGEHIQFVHLFLAPIYYFWSSHLMLELAESMALASGAIPVFWIAKRWSASARCATCLAVCYLLYPPLQFLDIAIDLKTFRPMSFGIPAMLFAFDQFERGRLKTTLALFVLALTAKEDFALILGPFGVWVAAQAVLPEKMRAIKLPWLVKRKLGIRLGISLGIGLAVFSVAYLLLTTRVLIPWFRAGEEVHYARYFAKFGDSMGDILKNMLTNPGLLFRELITIPSTNFVLGLLAPLGFVALLSPSRFLVGVPVLVLLCLNQIIQQDPNPWHHFHGPIIPVLFWSTAASLQNVKRLIERTAAFDKKSPFRFLWRLTPSRIETVAVFCVSMSFFVGVCVAMSPTSIRFWDSGSTAHWQKLYVPGQRAIVFERVFSQIPLESRVASTDFVHPRFTHHERSYDYSHYVRKVAGYENRVPDDTDYIVIDCKHRYSDIQSPAEVRELQIEPDKWELLEDNTNGFFIVLKRRP